jgi:hypothetical protein
MWDYGASLLNAPNSLALIAGLGTGTSCINRHQSAGHTITVTPALT